MEPPALDMPLWALGSWLVLNCRCGRSVSLSLWRQAAPQELQERRLGDVLSRTPGRWRWNSSGSSIPKENPVPGFSEHQGLSRTSVAR